MKLVHHILFFGSAIAFSVSAATGLYLAAAFFLGIAMVTIAVPYE